MPYPDIYLFIYFLNFSSLLWNDRAFKGIAPVSLQIGGIAGQVNVFYINAP